MTMRYCALCCIARDEEWYIDEWVEYHLALGFDAVILYDNHSRVPLAERLHKHIAAGTVIVHQTPGEALGEAAQSAAYTHCMTAYKDAFMWIAVIDADEIIVLKKHTNIKAFLSEYENYGGLLLNWVFYADPNALTSQNASQIESFVYRHKDGSTTGKSIVRPQRVAEFTGPHGPSYLPPYYAVNTEHLPLEPCAYSGPFVDDSAQVNHYWLRTNEDFSRKVALWKQSGRVLDDSFETQAARYVVHDPSAVALRDALFAAKTAPLPRRFAAVADLTDFFMTAVQQPRLRPHLEPMLADAMCCFPDEPLIWVFRSILSRLQGQHDRAFHCIRQALKGSGSSTVYFELSRVYQAQGDEVRSRRARVQAEYKKRIEETTCV